MPIAPSGSAIGVTWGRCYDAAVENGAEYERDYDHRPTRAVPALPDADLAHGLRTVLRVCVTHIDFPHRFLRPTISRPVLGSRPENHTRLIYRLRKS